MRFLMIAAATFLLGACGFVETFQEVQSQAEAAAAILQKDVGTRPLMGWNVNNGKFTNLNVVFDGTIGGHDVRARARVEGAHGGQLELQGAAAAADGVRPPGAVGIESCARI